MVIVHAFIDAITRGWIHIGMRIMKEFEEIILKNDKRVLPSLLQSFKDSPYLMDLKLSMLKLFLPLLQFHYIDVLITNFAYMVEHSTSANGIMITNINPFLMVATMLEIFSKIKSKFPLANLRIQVLERKLTDNVKNMLSDIY